MRTRDIIRLALAEPDIDEWDTVACRRCYDMIGTRLGCEPSPLCDACAQELLTELCWRLRRRSPTEDTR